MIIVARERIIIGKLDFDTLETKFNIRLVKPTDALYSSSAVELLDPIHMQSFVAYYASLIKALDYKVAAAYFSNWFSGVALALQYTVSIYNIALDLSLPNLTIHVTPVEGHTQVSFCLNRWREQVAPLGEQERLEWRHDVLAGFYGNTMRPLVESLSSVSNMNVGQIWGQLPTKFSNNLDIFKKSTRHLKEKQRLVDDYYFLTKELSPYIFGRTQNPFDVKFRMVEDLRDPEQQIRMNNVCCQYVRTEEGVYCYNCPRMTDDDREARRMIYRFKTLKDSDRGESSSSIF